MTEHINDRSNGSKMQPIEYVGEKVDEWVNELAEFAVSQPQASYAAFTFDSVCCTVRHFS